jgi:predicted nuclease of predicted toxin-antitoxin system
MVPMRLLIDECVRRTVAEIFSNRGHQVYFAIQELGQSTPDALVAAAADRSQLILVTCNYRHFKGLISRRPPDNQVRFRHAGLISFERCSDAKTDSRLRQTLESIEFEFEQSQKRPDKRLIVGIFPDEFRAYY